ncbi:hypothetical protein AB5J62_33730 [Amycolatopsis sp. cg5]|uniref:hypothetical protein n=1 Tax=Amycolatopsis sp. cg5 TaxID=3238802 RepID=UPI0035232FAC
MSWFKVDDGFYDHPKVFDASDCTVALWTRAGSWSARNLTDGFVPSNLPVRLCGDPDTAIRELVERGLWSRIRGGYKFHDWTDYQPTRADVEAERERWRRNKARQRKARSPDIVSTGDTPGESLEIPLESPEESPRRVSRSRPDPESPKGDSRGGRANVRARGARSPTPSPADRQPRASPDVRCVEHEHDDDPPRCGACARARRQHEQAAYEQRVDARRAELAATRADKRRAIENCSMCDENGYRGTSLCHHDPHAEARASRGRALVNELMGWNSNDEPEPP